MNRGKTIGWTILFLLAGCVAMGRAADPGKIRVLIVTGNDYPGHVWKETTPAVRQILEQDPRMVVRVIEDPEFLASPALDQYDVVVLNYMNWESPDPSRGASENLQRFVQEGKGLVLLHFSCGAWGGWPEFQNLAGRCGTRSTRTTRGPFRVDVVNQDHPVTRAWTRLTPMMNSIPAWPVSARSPCSPPLGRK